MNISQIFENNFDCYADTLNENLVRSVLSACADAIDPRNTILHDRIKAALREVQDGSVTMAMTKEKFIEVVGGITKQRTPPTYRHQGY